MAWCSQATRINLRQWSRYMASSDQEVLKKIVFLKHCSLEKMAPILHTTCSIALLKESFVLIWISKVCSKLTTFQHCSQLTDTICYHLATIRYSPKLFNIAKLSVSVPVVRSYKKIINLHRIAHMLHISHLFSTYTSLIHDDIIKNIFRVTGLLCGEFTGHRWSPFKKARVDELSCFHWSGLSKRLIRQ